MVVNEQLNSTNHEAFLTSREAATLLHCHPKTLERHARSGDVPAHFKLSRWYFLPSEIDAWLRNDVQTFCDQLARVN